MKQFYVNKLINESVLGNSVVLPEASLFKNFKIYLSKREGYTWLLNPKSMFSHTIRAKNRTTGRTEFFTTEKEAKSDLAEYLINARSERFWIYGQDKTKKTESVRQEFSRKDFNKKVL